MANKKPWSPFYWADYLNDTGHLSMIEHGAYLQLMAHYYQTRRPLPANAEQLHRLCRCFAADEQAAVDAVLRQFFVRDGSVYRHARIDAELAKANEISEKRAESARCKHRNRTSKRSANAEQAHTQSQSQHKRKYSSNTSCPEPDKPAAEPVLSIPLVDGSDHPIYPSDLEEWRKAFPAIDLMEQLHRIRVWNVDNPANRKTRRGVRRHITTWLARAQDRAPRRNSDGKDNRPSRERSDPLAEFTAGAYGEFIPRDD